MVVERRAFGRAGKNLARLSGLLHPAVHDKHGAVFDIDAGR